MDDGALTVVVRTPREIVAELEAHALRVPSDTGQVGLRPRCEPTLLAVEPGLAIARTAEGLRFVATAGGILRCDGSRAILLTPIGVVGNDAGAVSAALEQALAAPSADLELRRTIERLESGILRELRRSDRATAPEPQP